MTKIRLPLIMAVLYCVTSVAAQQHNIEGLTHSQISSERPSLFGAQESELDGTLGTGEIFSLAPFASTAGTNYYLNSAGVPTNHTFDTVAETGGSNFFGTAGGFIVVDEAATYLGGGVDRYEVQVTTVNSSVIPERWVASNWSGNGLIAWRLDVGSTLGGTDPINFLYPGTIVGSGVDIFSSTAAYLGSLSLASDTSTATSLSGVAIVPNGGFDIAGVDVASLRIFWNRTRPAELAVQIVDAVDGAYVPGASLDVLVGIENLGYTASVSGSMKIYASTDTTITVSDRLLDTFVVPPINPLGLSIGFAPTVIPGDLANGNYYIGVILTYSDPNGANNLRYDPVPITVSNAPEIRIQPSSLNFVEEAQALTAEAESNQQDHIEAVLEVTQAVFPQLLESAQRNGKVRVIVGLDVPTKPEGLLSDSGKQAQRQNIRSIGNQLVAAMRGYNSQENARFQFIPFMALTVDANALRHLSRLPIVTSIEEDKLSSPTLASSNAVIGSPLAWTEGYDGTGQTVAILDTGVDKAHPWFTTGGSTVVSEACYSTTSANSVSVCPGGVSSSTAVGSGVNCSTAAVAFCDHGTHVAGIAAGNDNAGPNFGVARNANLIAIQVFSQINNQVDCGTDPAPCVRAFNTDIISGLERVYALRNDFNVAAANMSLGGGRFFDQTSCDAANPSMKAAIVNLRSANIATVIASGNSFYKDSIGFPGCISSAISVGNTTDIDDVSPSSNIYPQIHLLAPGTDITSSVPGGATSVKTGTSMSAPHIAGAWAVLKQKNPVATVSQILATLQSTATPIDDLRVGGIETDMPRINLDLALGEPRATFGIFNEGPADLNITSITRESPAPWITWSPQAPLTLKAGELKVMTVNVDYATAPAGASQTRLLVNSNDPNESPYPGGIYINVTALADPAPEFQSTPGAGATVAFGNQIQNTESSAMLIDVDNLGNANLTLGCSLVGTNPTSFKIKACPTPISGGGSANISIACQPVSIGAKSATLTVATNDLDEPSVNYSLTCTGIEQPPEFDSTPTGGATIAFGNQIQNIESSAMLIDVDNLGGANLTLGCSLTGANPTSFKIKACPSPIAGAGSANISVTCQPVSVGAKTANLAVTTNDADETNVSYNLTCTGIELPQEFDSTPAANSTIAFGDQVESVESSAMLIDVDNLGGANLTLACSLGGANPTSFNIKACPTPILGGGSANISITCQPVSIGAKSASLDVTTNDEDETNISYNLTCNGTEEPPDNLIFSDGFES